MEKISRDSAFRLLKVFRDNNIPYPVTERFTLYTYASPESLESPLPEELPMPTSDEMSEWFPYRVNGTGIHFLQTGRDKVMSGWGYIAGEFCNGKLPSLVEAMADALINLIPVCPDEFRKHLRK